MVSATRLLFLMGDVSAVQGHPRVIMNLVPIKSAYGMQFPISL